MCVHHEINHTKGAAEKKSPRFFVGSYGVWGPSSWGCSKAGPPETECFLAWERKKHVFSKRQINFFLNCWLVSTSPFNLFFFGGGKKKQTNFPI